MFPAHRETQVSPAIPEMNYPVVATLEIAQCLGTSSLELKLAFLEFELKLKSYGKIMRINFKKLGQNIKKSKAENLTTKSTRGMIGEKLPGEELVSSPSKKSKVTDSSKGKEVVTQPEPKKKTVATKSHNAASSKPTPVRKPGEGTSGSPSVGLGPRASFLASPFVAEKILSGVIPLADQEKVKQLTFDQTTMRFFHTLGQALMFGSSVVVRGREALEELALQQGQVASLEDENLPWRNSRFEYEVAVENAASKYFGEGFDFCKRQLRRLHPDLAIDLKSMGFDHYMLAEEDNKDEESGGEKEKEDGKKGNNNFLLPKQL
ncbi:hypothetical protein Acr_00g0075340 [Actinidia rufa]|uniref:Uncharacterized protein n=1 Tax=Actinidia rufa TaxID=165716 RepID=A0A7J0DSR9_9ERIC|nr:hypothetical protein Acr_00g0075340 [Actinidia rufa]